LFKEGQNINYFYCNGDYSYFNQKKTIDEDGNIKEGVNHFVIINLVLKETNTPNVFEVVEYEISRLYKCKKEY